MPVIADNPPPHPEPAWPVVGHKWAVALLQNALETGRQAHAYLISGPAQIGRCTLALALARALNCTGDSAPCQLAGSGVCRACRLIAAGTHPDVRVIVPEGASIKIDQVRELQHDLALSPVEGRFRVAIVDGMEKATAEASNALLKTLEEPPPYVVLVLVALEPELLLPTIVSRCQPVPLRPLALEEVKEALVSRWGVAEERAGQLAHLSGGRLGWAVVMAQDEGLLHKRAARLDELARLLDAKRVARFAYAEELAGDNAAALETLDLLESWWRDVMLVAAGSRAPLVNVDRRAELEQQAARFGVERARQAIAALSRTAWQIRHNANARLAIETLLLDLPGK
ncbi:MAG: DNA polymerase III subunit delta' [Thermoflexales bacterium]|nr:DNA polymerase III subunit delta' [Thermoflexales bacterium]